MVIFLHELRWVQNTINYEPQRVLVCNEKNQFQARSHYEMCKGIYVGIWHTDILCWSPYQPNDWCGTCHQKFQPHWLNIDTVSSTDNSVLFISRKIKWNITFGITISLNLWRLIWIWCQHSVISFIKITVMWSLKHDYKYIFYYPKNISSHHTFNSWHWLWMSYPPLFCLQEFCTEFTLASHYSRQ